MADTKLKLEVIMAAVDRITRPLKAVLDGSKATSTQVKALRDKLKDLNSQAGQIEAFRKLQGQTAVVGHNMAEAQAKVKRLADQINATDTPTKALTRAFTEAKREANQLTNQHQEMTQRVQRQRDALNAAGLATTQLASHQRSLKGEIGSVTSALESEQKKLEAISKQASTIRAAQARVAKAKESAGKLGSAGATAMAAGAAVGAATSVPVKAYADAEEAATNLKVSMMGANGQVSDTYKQVTALATQLGNKLPGTTADYMNMMTMLQRQGLGAEKILGGVGEATAYLAVQLKKTPEAAAEFAAKMQDATRATDREMLALMDTIQRAYYLGVDDNNMLQGFSKLSPALSILRKEGTAAAKDLAPLLVMADQAGLAGEAAGNAYRKIFQAALGTKKIDKANAALQGTGVTLNFTNGKGEFGGIDQLFAQLAQLKAVNTQQRLAALKEAFGDDAETLQALTLLIEKGKDGYTEVAARMQAQADIQQRVNEQLGTLKSLWDAASGTFTNAMAAFGESIAPQVKAATQWIGSLAERMQIWATENPKAAGTLMTVVKWVGLALIGFGGLAVAVAAVLGPFAMAKLAFTTLGISGAGLGGALGTVLGVLKTISLFLLTNPIGLAITAIAAAAALIWANWDTIKTATAAAWDWITQKASTAARFLVDLFLNWTLPGLIIKHWDSITTFMSALPEKFATMGGQIIDGLISGLSQRWESAKAWFTEMGNKIAQTTRDSLGIKSPSRVFTEIGQHVMSGLGIGLEGNEDTPLNKARSTAAKLAAIGMAVGAGSAGTALANTAPITFDTRPPLASRSSNQGAAPQQSVVNHITITAPQGMDERALARLVAAEIEKATRQSQSAKRSRLTDRD